MIIELGKASVETKGQPNLPNLDVPNHPEFLFRI